MPRVWSGLCSKRGTGLWRVPGCGAALGDGCGMYRQKKKFVPLASRVIALPIVPPRRREEVKLTCQRGSMFFAAWCK